MGQERERERMSLAILVMFVVEGADEYGMGKEKGREERKDSGWLMKRKRERERVVGRDELVSLHTSISRKTGTR